MILLTMAVAILIPNIDQIIPFVGFSAGMLLAFIFPALIDVLVFLPHEIAEHIPAPTNVLGGEGGERPTTEAAWRSKKVCWRVAKNAGFVLIGMLAGVTGLVFTIRDIIDAHGA